jgi:hypothetical protein
MVGAEEEFRALRGGGRQDPSWAFLTEMRSLGHRAAERWLSDNLASVWVPAGAWRPRAGAFPHSGSPASRHAIGASACHLSRAKGLLAAAAGPPREGRSTMFRVAAPWNRTLRASGKTAVRRRHRPARFADHAFAAAADGSAPLRTATVERAAKLHPPPFPSPLRTASTAEIKLQFPIGEPLVALS